MAYTTIKKPSEYFNTKLYSGNGSTQSITGVGFQPDLIWSKGRSLAGFDHSVTDSVRGNTKRIFPSRTDAEATCTVAVTSFDSDGFSLGDDNCATLANLNNYNGQTYVNWLWKANGAGVANTDGSISSTVSASATSGFSIVSYTGTGANATVGHGLSSTPKMIFFKRRDADDAWWTYNETVGSGGNLVLNSSNAQGSNGAVLWNSTAPTSSVFSVGTNGGVNASSGTYIAYAFADVKGFSKFGSYTGNGSASSGTFIYTGFKPAFVMVKSTNAVKSWMILDNKRNPSGLSGANTVDYRLRADTNEATSDNAGGMDFLSNGFKFYSTDTSTNQSGTNYIYMAFAEQPLVGDNPCTAR